MKIVANNKKAFFEYEILDQYTAGIKLEGSEVKSIKDGKASFNGAYCIFKDGELFVKNMHVAEYKQGGKFNNHDPFREKKLLLTKKELNKLLGKVTVKGNSIVPLKLIINSKGYIKLDIALVRGKKLHDKRETIKERDIQRDMDRNLKP